MILLLQALDYLVYVPVAVSNIADYLLCVTDHIMLELLGTLIPLRSIMHSSDFHTLDFSNFAKNVFLVVQKLDLLAFAMESLVDVEVVVSVFF